MMRFTSPPNNAFLVAYSLMLDGCDCDPREPDGPKLVKRDAPLVPGDRLKGGQYISFCTSWIATGCKPKYLEVSAIDDEIVI